MKNGTAGYASLTRPTALMDMLKEDIKKRKIDDEYMEILEELNDLLSDPEPKDKIRNEDHGKGQHGHYGPWGHFPVKKKK